MGSHGTPSEWFKVRRLRRDGNYREWAANVRALLVDADLASYLETEASEGDDAAMTRQDKCKARLLLSVEGPLQSIVEKAATAKAAWQQLEKEHLGSLQTRRPMLLGEVRELKQGPKETVEAYGDRAKALLSRLEDLDLSCADVLVADAFLQGLRSSFHPCVPILTRLVDEGFDAVLLELKNLTRLMPDAVVRGDAGVDKGKLLQTEGKGRGKKRETRRCFLCGKTGHLKKDCWQGNGGQQAGNVGQQAGNAHPPPAAGVLMASGAQAPGTSGVPGSKGEGALLFDSGATHHIVRDVSCVYNCHMSPVQSIVLGGGETHQVLCAGDVDVYADGKIVTLSGALCVPAIRYDLLSGVQATARGARCTLDGDSVVIHDADGCALLSGSKQHGLYHIEGQVVPRETSTAIACVLDGELGHRRLGHPGVSATRRMLKEMGADSKQDCFDVGTCEVCTTAKQCRESFPRSTSLAESPLQLLHMDVMGPFNVPSLGDARYALTIMDDYSHYSEVHCIKSKSDVFQCARGTMVLWQRQTGRKVKVVRTDNGSEFQGLLQEWFVDKGIAHQTSADYTPEQNGRAERLNRTLIEKTRALLLDHNLPKQFWGAAIDTACYLCNRLTPEGGGPSPLELLFGSKPDLSCLRVFGCLAFVHVPKGSRGKLDACSEPGVFVGYEHSCKAWRVYVWGDGRFHCVKSRNVKFMEDCRPDAVLSECDLEQEDVALFCPVDLQRDDEYVPSGATEGEEADGGLHEEASAAGSSAVEDNDGEEGTEGPRYPSRVRRQPVNPYSAYINQVEDGSDRPTLSEALNRSDAPLWQQAITEELAALQQMGVYEVCKRPEGKKVLPTKMVLEVKRDATGRVEKYKARLVALGCRQIAGKDYDEVFAPTVQRATLRILLSHATAEDLEVHQTDIKTAFLNGELAEEVYVAPPPSVQQANTVWRLKKALYGLKQAARAWHAKLRKELVDAGFRPSEYDPCLFMAGSGPGTVYALVHVDDALLAGSSDAVAWAKAAMANVFEVKDLGEASYFLGLEIVRDRLKKTCWVGQSRYCSDKLLEFGFADSKPQSTPCIPNTHLSKDGVALENESVPYMSVVGSLLYLAVNTRPDISFAVGVLSRFMAAPRAEHWQAAKRVLRYLCGSPDFGILYGGGAPGVQAYCDADFAGDPDSRKSTTGVLILFNGGPVVWSSKLQTVVAASTCEAEYVAAAAAAKEALWVGSVLAEFTGMYKPVTLSMDNQAAITLVKHCTAGVSARTKHIDVAMHVVRDYVMRGDLGVRYVPTKDMKADMLTKGLTRVLHVDAVAKVGLVAK